MWGRIPVITGYTYRYSNGDEFMSDVADAIEKAKKEIYITDWM